MFVSLSFWLQNVDNSVDRVRGSMSPHMIPSSNSEKDGLHPTCFIDVHRPENYQLPLLTSIVRPSKAALLKACIMKTQSSDE